LQVLFASTPAPVQHRSASRCSWGAFCVLCPLPLVQELGTIEQSLAPCPCIYLQGFMAMGEWDSPESPLLHVEHPQLSHPLFPVELVLSSSEWLFTKLFSVCSGLPCTGGTITGPSTPGVASPLLSRGVGSILMTKTPMLCLVHLRIPSSSLMGRAHYCLMFNLVSTRTPRSFLSF